MQTVLPADPFMRLYPVKKRFYSIGCDHLWDDSAPIEKVLFEGSLRMKWRSLYSRKHESAHVHVLFSRTLNKIGRDVLVWRSVTVSINWNCNKFTGTC